MAPAPPTDPAAVAAWVADRLDEGGIPYAIGGALALAAHAVPRATKDVDFSVFVPEPDLDRLFDAVERAGCLLDRSRARADVDRVALFAARHGRVGIDFFVSFQPHHHEALARRVAFPGPDGRPRWFLSAEDLAIHKLALARAKDHMDLEHLFAAVGDRMDVAYVRRWLHALTGEGDPRRSQLESLVSRFGAPTRPG